MKKRKIILYPFNQKFHNLYDETINLFSDKYSLVYSPSKKSKFYNLKNNHFIRKSYYNLINLMRKYNKKDKIKEVFPSSFSKEDILFCFNQLPPEGVDFILDLEMVTGISGYNYDNLDREYIKKRLSNNNCKKIICWNKSSYESLVKIIDSKSFKHKIQIIPFSRVPQSIFIKRKSLGKQINLLFVSSMNNPGDFENKGGIIALESYKEFNKLYPDSKFFVRANVPKKIEKKYRNVPGLFFIKKYLPNHKMQELFLNSDILLEPVPGIALLLECMDYQIPPISLDYWCIKDMVFNDKSGILFDSTKIFGSMKNTEKYFKDLFENYKKLSQKEIVNFYVPLFVNSLVRLKENDLFFNKLRNFQRRLLEKDGKFNSSLRNMSLVEIIDSLNQ